MIRWSDKKRKAKTKPSSEPAKALTQHKAVGEGFGCRCTHLGLAILGIMVYNRKDKLIISCFKGAKTPLWH